MSTGVVFNDEDRMRRTSSRPRRAQPGIIAITIRYGIAKNASQATALLIGIVIVCSVIATYFFVRSTSSPYQNQKDGIEPGLMLSTEDRARIEETLAK